MTLPQSDATPAGPVKLGFLLPTRGLLLCAEPPADADRILNLARQAEAGGLDSLWVGDSLTAKPRMEPLATLSAVAAVTERARLGTAVLLMALRHPVLLAQTLATVDLIAKGRLLVAAGVGGAFNDEQQREWQAAGVAATRRASRLEEMARIVKGLGGTEPVTFAGRHFNMDGVSVGPKPVQTGGIPLLLSCHWRAKARESQIRRAAKLADGIISISDTPEEYAQVVGMVQEKAVELGRNPDALERVMYLTVNMDTDTGRAAAESERYLLGYYGSNMWGSRWGPFGEPERVKERIAEYAAAGAQTVIVRLASFDPERQLNDFLEKVVPAFR